MASVTSLDADMRSLRLARYTPQAEAEARAWIEKTLSTSLGPGDLLEALKDGVALCKLASLAIQPQYGAIKFKASAMPFIQMENISHFLKACELPPLSLPAHDRFLTVDLFEQKDPAQVLQCLGAFSRQANRMNPAKFPVVIGPKTTGSSMSPTSTGGAVNHPSWRRAPSPTKNSTHTARMSPVVTGGSTGSQKGNSRMSPKAPVSSWSKSSDEVSTAPAWNIHQYGYMGGASQGNQGVSFGARRQITTQTPSVPSLAEKQKIRREKELEAQRLQQEEAEERQRQRVAAEEEERVAKAEEGRIWEEETRRLRDEERKQIENQKREWEEQEMKWKEEEEARRKEDAALQASITKVPPAKPRAPSSNILKGQTLAEWQREQAGSAKSAAEGINRVETPEQKRVRELERQLEEARERERQYQTEREERFQKVGSISAQPTPLTTESALPRSSRESDASWAADEREHVRSRISNSRENTPSKAPLIGSQRPLPSEPRVFPNLPQPPSEPRVSEPAPGPELAPPSLPTRPLPEPFVPSSRIPNRTDQFLSSNPAPSSPVPRISSSREAGDTSLEQSRLNDARTALQQKTKASGWAGKSLLEREMERERERQREWEANQATLKEAPRDATQGTGEGQSWDVSQYGYMGGDNMNRGSSVGSGINFGGRRQIVGPRAKP